MKITLYTPDGTAETFTDCVLVPGDSNKRILAFKGTDALGKRVGRVTNAKFVIDPGTTEEILNSSPITEIQ